MAQKNLFPTKINRESLNALVDRAADLIRTAVDYKFILVLLFLKRLNDVRKREREQIKERLINESELSEKEAEEEISGSKRKLEDMLNTKIRYHWGRIDAEKVLAVLRGEKIPQFGKTISKGSTDRTEIELKKADELFHKASILGESSLCPNLEQAIGLVEEARDLYKQFSSPRLAEAQSLLDKVYGTYRSKCE